MSEYAGKSLGERAATPFSEAALRTRIKNIIGNAFGHDLTMGDVAVLGEQTLRNLNGIGRWSIYDIRQELRRHSVDLRR